MEGASTSVSIASLCSTLVLGACCKQVVFRFDSEAKLRHRTKKKLALQQARLLSFFFGRILKETYSFCSCFACKKNTFLLGRPKKKIQQALLASRDHFFLTSHTGRKKKNLVRSLVGFALSPLGAQAKAWSTNGDGLIRRLPDRWGPLGFPHDRKSSVPTLSERLLFAVSLLGVQAAPGQPKGIGSPAPAG